MRRSTANWIGVSNGVGDVPHEHGVAIKRGAVLDESSHARVPRIHPLLKTVDEDWSEDGILIIGWLLDAAVNEALLAHGVVDSVAEKGTEMLSY